MNRRDREGMAYPVEVVELLWPDSAGSLHVVRRRQGDLGAHRNFYVFPSSRRPRLLLPAELRISADMLQRLGKGRHGFVRLARQGVVLLVRSRVFPWVGWPMLRAAAAGGPATDSIETYVSTHLGVEVRVGVLLGTRRPNRKPVLQIFGADGRVIGYGKVGRNALTASLVRHEAQALASLGQRSLTTLRVPRLLHAGHWRSLDVLLMSALGGDAREPVPDERRHAAMRELCELNGIKQETLTTSAFWCRVTQQVALLPDGADRSRLMRHLASVENAYGRMRLGFGAWHGDWGAWNMAMCDGVVEVWDWERYDDDVPLGFDGVHYAAQRVRPEGSGVESAEAQFLASLPHELAELGVPVEHHQACLALYLLEVSLRYQTALQYSPTTPLLARSSWAISLLERRLSTTAYDYSGGERP